jgi:hypothetical protein
MEPITPPTPPTPQVPPPPSISQLETKPPGGGILSKLSPMKWVLLILVFGVVAVGVVIMFSGAFSESKIVLEIEGPGQIQSGEEVTYKVHYRNGSDVKLENVKFTFTYPIDSVVLKNGQIRESLVENIELDSLSSGDEGDFEFTAYIVGDTGDARVARAVLSYKPSDVRSEFDKKVDLSTTITSFAIPLTLIATPSAISGQEVIYTLDYRNESDGDFEGLRIKFKYPEGFSPTSFSPSPDIGTDIWRISSLDKGAGERIRVTGNMIGREDEDKTVSVVLQREVDGNNIDFERTKSTTVISSPPLLINVTLNNRTDYVAKPGDSLRYKVSFTNTSRSTLTGVNLNVKLDGDAFDLSTYTGDGFLNSNTRTISWNASNIPALANLQSGQSAEAQFVMRLKEPLPVEGSAKNFFVKVIVSLETTNVPKEFGLDELIVSQDLLTKIATVLNFNQTAHYNDPAAGFSNTGPIPPKVGVQTTYTIHWTIDGTSNDVVNARIIGFLPPGVVWTNNVTVNANQPSVTYEPGTGRLVWNLEVVPAGTGTSLPRYQAIFQVAITPTNAQLNHEVELIRKSEFEGQDGFTKDNIQKFAFPLTTDDVVDQRGKGEVE